MTLYTIRQKGANGYVYVGAVCVSQFGVTVIGADAATAMRFDSVVAARAVLEVVRQSNRRLEGWYIKPIESIVREKEECDEEH